MIFGNNDAYERRQEQHQRSFFHHGILQMHDMYFFYMPYLYLYYREKAKLI